MSCLMLGQEMSLLSHSKMLLSLANAVSDVSEVKQTRACQVHPAPNLAAYRHPTTSLPPLCHAVPCFLQTSQSVNKGSGVENLHYLGDGLFGTKQLD